MLECNRLRSAGVAELADAQDLGFYASQAANFRRHPQHSARLSKRPSLYFRKLTLFSASLCILWLQVSESLAQNVSLQERKAYSIPFRADHGYLLLQTTVNGKQAVLILDTGSPVSFSSGHVLQFHAKADTVSFRFDDRTPLSAQYYRPDKIAYDGILGNDQLRQFRAVRIDYKTQTVTLEE